MKGEPMVRSVKRATRRKQFKARAWLRWTLLFVPLFVAGMVTLEWLGFRAVAVGIAIVVLTMLYQHLVNRRSWSSIFWGDPDLEDKYSDKS